MSESDLNKYGFISAAWKRGLVIGILTLQTIAIVWLAKTTVPKSSYKDCMDEAVRREAKLYKYERVLNPKLDSLEMRLEQVRQKTDDNETILNKAIKIKNNADK
ncbi:hypothetical protein [Niabella aurantiaca]|uniref:hypothetical protein n=1 Tax=Niabella aurantiaca TaxID=379900 RepID=UPI0003815670|nr:hypothetical protein [Niabella aurantiaca]